MTALVTPIDLRSDTVTKPTDAMRRAMATAEVGDDVYGEDPTVRRLEDTVADILGQEAALFVPSGTMANQIALQLHCRPGDEVLCQPGTHLHRFESGAGSAYAGVQFVEGFMTLGELEVAVRPTGPHASRLRLLVLENTHGDGGGVALSICESRQMAEAASSQGLALHLDGARIWNAAARFGCSEAELAAPFDTVTACFSKGLGAPAGSVLAGGTEAIRVARHLRRRMGGGMRQAGILAAGALYALEHHRSRLKDDHANARLLADLLPKVAELPSEPHATPLAETNIVFFTTEEGAAAEFCERAARSGVLLHAVGPSSVRAVTHLDVDDDGIRRAVQRLASMPPASRS